jgi:hypothetical protein
MRFTAILCTALAISCAGADASYADGPVRRLVRGTATVAAVGTLTTVRGATVATRGVVRGAALGTRAVVSGAAHGTAAVTGTVVRGTAVGVRAGARVVTPFRYRS